MSMLHACRRCKSAMRLSLGVVAVSLRDCAQPRMGKAPKIR